MTLNRSLIMALLIVVAAPMPALAQGGQGGQGRGMGQGGMGGLMAARALLDQGSVEYLAEHAAALQLEAAQTAALKAIGVKWAADTKESRDRVRAVLPAPGPGTGQGQGMGGDRQAMMQQTQTLLPVMVKLQEDDVAALEEAMSLLSESQQAAARKLLEDRTARMRRPGG
jgi:hypothetical protein